MASTSRQPSSAMNSPERHRLSEVDRLLSILARDIPKVRAFTGKWSQLTKKLEDLPSYLRHLSMLPSSSAVTHLLHFIFTTLSDVVVLAHQCINPYPTNGKLRTNSDIDILVANLDQFMKDVDLLDSKGLLDIEDNSGSDKSDIGLEAMNLIKKLRKVDSLASKISTMDSLMELLGDDDWKVMIAMDLGLFPVLLPLLNSAYLEIKQKCLSLICEVIMPHNYLDGYCDSLIGPLHSFLELRDGFSDEQACICLQNLSLSRNSAIAMGSKRGLIASLLEICQTGSPSSQADAVSTLNNISNFYENSNEIFVDENAMAILINLTSTGSSPKARQHAIECLNKLVEHDVNLKREFVLRGGIECLKTYWDNIAPSSRSLGVAAKLVKNLATCRKIGDLIVFKGLIPKLGEMLKRCGIANLRIAALSAIYELSLASRKTRRKIGKAKIGKDGLIALILTRSLLGGEEGVGEKETAVVAMSSLMQSAGNLAILAKEKEVIKGAIQRLDPHNRDEVKKYLVSVLASAASNSKINCRKKAMKISKALDLQNVLDMEINGARRICDSMHRTSISSARPSISLCRGSIDEVN